MNLNQELLTIRRKHRGRLTPRIVLKEASKPDHPLHNRFEWDDSTAAHKYRLEQAHDLIVSVRLGYKDASGQRQDVRGFHAIRAADEQEYDYLPVDEILGDPMYRKLLFRDMERQIAELVARYGHVKEFWALLKKQKPDAA